MDPVSKLKELWNAGQSIWYDYIRRDQLQNGELDALVKSGVRGLTSNPSIFEKAIADTALYDGAIASLGDVDASSAFEAVALEDIRGAADVLRPVFDDSDGKDGYASFEVSPTLAYDTEGTIRDAKRLWEAIDRPNVMIKVPATAEGIPAIEELTSVGINVNATLMFSLADYEAVAMAYVHGASKAERPDRLASVASFFVSRVDSYVDSALEAVGTDEALSIRGTIAIANAQIAYARYLEIFEGPPFGSLASAGTRPQRPLWASTSTKNPSYRDVLYVEELIGPNTVNTAPPATIEAFEDHGVVKRDSLLDGIETAASRVEALAAVGVDFAAITDKLQTDGVAAFASAYNAVLDAIADKQAKLAS